MLTGAGIGLRGPHVAELARRTPAVDWLEVLADNHLGAGDLEPLLALRADYPMALHAVSMNLGGTDPLDFDHIRAIGALADRLDVAVVSDHVAFTAHRGRHVHDLLPVPFAPAVADHIAERVARVQDVLGRRILVENASRYLAFEADVMSEAAFLCRIVERADCGLLLDVNNAFVSQRNLGADAEDLLGGLPLDRVGQIHLAGHADHGDHVVDTHDGPVSDAVMTLFTAVQRRRPGMPAMIEWDTDVPALEVLLAEADRIRSAMRAAEEATWRAA